MNDSENYYEWQRLEDELAADIEDETYWRGYDDGFAAAVKQYLKEK
jgi:hypothetical protein